MTWTDCLPCSLNVAMKGDLKECGLECQDWTEDRIEETGGLVDWWSRSREALAKYETIGCVKHTTGSPQTTGQSEAPL